MKVAFDYLGRTRDFPCFIFEVLPRFDVHVYPDDGYIAVVWLLWACELRWRYRECAD